MKRCHIVSQMTWLYTVAKSAPFFHAHLIEVTGSPPSKYAKDPPNHRLCSLEICRAVTWGWGGGGGHHIYIVFSQYLNWWDSGEGKVVGRYPDAHSLKFISLSVFQTGSTWFSCGLVLCFVFSSIVWHQGNTSVSPPVGSWGGGGGKKWGTIQLKFSSRVFMGGHVSSELPSHSFQNSYRRKGPNNEAWSLRLGVCG